MSFIPDLPHARVVTGSDYVTIPALSTYGATQTGTCQGASSNNTINVTAANAPYASVGGTILITGGASSGQRRLITGTTSNQVIFNNQPVLVVSNNDPYSIIMNQGAFDTPTSSTRLKLFQTSIFGVTVINWQTQLRDAIIKVTSGAANGIIFQVKTYVPGTYTAILYSPISILPAAGDTWQILSISFQANNTNNVAKTITLSSTLNAQLIRPFPAGSLIVGLTNQSNTFGNVCTYVSTTALTTVNVSNTPTFGTATGCFFRIFNGVVPSNLRTQIMSDATLYTNCSIRLYQPVNRGTSSSLFVASAKDDKLITDTSTIVNKNSLSVILTPINLDGSEVVEFDNVVTKSRAYWVENYTSTSLVGVQMTMEYFR